MNQQTPRTVFFVSDRTGITVETIGRSLLTQFDGIEFVQIAVPFVDSEDKARAVVARIDACAAEGQQPLVFSTQVRPELRAILAASRGLYLDIFATFLVPLEQSLGRDSSHSIGRSHGMQDTTRYDSRMDAVNFALSCDDGVGTQYYASADVIIVGVSRSGKTPTCLYLAMQYGLLAANYPITDEDLEEMRLPSELAANRARLMGLTIAPERLQQIRQERRPDSTYASLRQYQYEVRQLDALFRREQLPVLDSTHMSIEEIAASVVHELRLTRKR